jgi:hypothetical protein
MKHLCVVTDPGIGIERFSRQGFESMLPGKKHPKLPEILQIWATFFVTIFFFAVFSAFLRVYPFGVNRNYCYGSFLWNLGIRIRKIRIGFKTFFLEKALRFGNPDPTKIRDS